MSGQGQRGVERLSAASGVTKYYYFGSQRVAMQTASGITYLHADHLASTSVTSGAVSSTQVYYPYGSVRAMTGSAPTDFGFTGQRLDSSSALMYYGARYYDAALGRFVTADSVVPQADNPQSLNRYAYVLNNPIRYTDPTGHCLPACAPAAVLGPAGWFLIGAGTALVVSYEVFWAPEAAEHQAAIGNAVGGAVRSAQTDLEVIAWLSKGAGRAIQKGLQSDTGGQTAGPPGSGT